MNLFLLERDADSIYEEFEEDHSEEFEDEYREDRMEQMISRHSY